jgi:archaemetzincin
MKQHLTVIWLLVELLAGCDSRPAPTSAEECIARLKDYDVTLEKPVPGDWLFDHPEPGQTFNDYFNSNPVRGTETRNKIYIQPLGVFTSAQLKVITNTAEYLKIFFDREIKIRPTLSDQMVPDSLKRNLGSAYEQLLTTPILDYLQKNMPDDGLIIMAITSKDLYPNSTYNFVFGQARTKKRVGVSSIFRYSDSLEDSIHYRQCLERLIKTSAHEMCHMFSCEHCTAAVCVMNGSNSMNESDSRPNRLCSTCLKKMQWNLGFDVRARLKNLDGYFTQHKLEKDSQLTRLDLQSID